MEVHALAKSGGNDTGICAQGAGVSCTDAAESSFGEVLGIPVAAIGLAFYSTAFILVLCARFLKSRDQFGFENVFLAGALASTLYSVVLAVASVTVVGKWCPLCITLYAVNIGLLATALVTHPMGIIGIKRLHAVPRQGGFWLALFLFLSMVPLTQVIYSGKADSLKSLRKDSPAQQKAASTIVEGRSPSQGSKDAPVVVVEFSDFECPYCQRLALSLKSAQKKRPDLFRYVFKHYPMDSSCNRDIQTVMHKHACGAALAMTCADEMGKAWALHDVMFANQSALKEDNLIAYAAHVGIDPERFSACMKSPAAMERVRDDINEAIRLGVEGTPTWYMNGIKQVGVRAPDELIAMFEQVNRDEQKKDDGEVTR